MKKQEGGMSRMLTFTILSISLLTVMAGAAVAPALGIIHQHFSEAPDMLIKFIVSMPARQWYRGALPQHHSKHQGWQGKRDDRHAAHFGCALFRTIRLAHNCGQLLQPALCRQHARALHRGSHHRSHIYAASHHNTTLPKPAATKLNNINYISVACYQ